MIENQEVKAYLQKVSHKEMREVALFIGDQPLPPLQPGAMLQQPLGADFLLPFDKFPCPAEPPCKLAALDSP